ncbi:hypothetical protein DZG01_13345 [Pseudomonas fluorescens]|nr:hypothetical protein DZG01_13345 [Pseudomonas fluorescens]
MYSAGTDPGHSWRETYIPCGSEPARDSGRSVCINAECANAIASRLAPTGFGYIRIGTTSELRILIIILMSIFYN